MAGRYSFPDSSPTPSTPDRSSTTRAKQWDFAEPSTTPAGPPPPDDTATSFTPAGAPSVSYLGSSIMRGASVNARSSMAPNTGAPNTSRSLFRGDSSRPQPKTHLGVSSGSGLGSPLGRSLGGNGPNLINGRRPSRLSKQYLAEQDEDELPTQSRPTGTFRFDYSDDGDDTEHDETMNEQDAEGEDDLGSEDGSRQHDYFLDEAERDESYLPNIAVPYLQDDNDTDLMIAASHANQRVLQEAEQLYKASTRFARLGAHREMLFARTAKEIHSQAEVAKLRENDDVILKTEELISRLYDEGVGTSDDPDRLNAALGSTSSHLDGVWQEFLGTINDSTLEKSPTIGPGPETDSFRKARWLASLVLQMHHTCYINDFGSSTPPLPEIMVDWLRTSHDVYSKAQLAEIVRYRPSPACHHLFWNSVINSVARGMVADAAKLLTEAGWGSVRAQGVQGGFAYTGQSLYNLQHAIQITVEMLQSCPGYKDSWETLGSEWSLFRIKAKTARDQLVRFAEGKDRAKGMGTSRLDSSQVSISNLAREAESKVPWEIYTQLQDIFDIALGKEATILGACQDWCEGSVALLAWLSEEPGEKPLDMARSTQSLLRKSVMAEPMNNPESYADRLISCFHVAVDEFTLNSMDPDEITYACAFEGNFEGVVAGLRMWSLPIATAVAEVASLGGWLPTPEPKNLIVMESLQQEDMELLGMESRGPDEIDGLKDTSLVEYAKELAGIGQMRSVSDNREIIRDGWEVAVQVLGRMHSRSKSEDMVGQLIGNLLEELSLDSSVTIDKVWTLLNALGMINFAEETVESYADLLSRESHRYGEALWYYALAHRPNKVREVLNLMISYSLMNSTVFPAAEDLDSHLDRLLTQRSTTLEQLAKKDLEAAELLGKMLAGYATLRKFYELRDGVSSHQEVRHGSVSPPESKVNLGFHSNGNGNNGNNRPMTNRQQASAALTAVIASSDDNIRGGLYDSTRDAVVSEDFLLALLGEALVFLKPEARGGFVGENEPDLTLSQLDVLFKAVEDVQTVGSRVFATAEEFFNTVLAGSAVASGPKDMLTKVDGGSGGGSFVMMSGSSVFASQLHKSFQATTTGGGGGGGMKRMGGGKGGGGGAGGGGGMREIKRGWDWRNGVRKGMGAKDVLRLMRLGLSREAARLWLVQADSVML